MDKVGFGEQRYLVYQHFDSGQTYLHVVTKNIQANGKQIDTLNIGRNQSEVLRKQNEKALEPVKSSRP